MTVGLRLGLRTSRYFPTINIAADEFAAGPDVSQDATSGRLVPASFVEWAEVMLNAGVNALPTSVYECQEASGNLNDSIGGVPFTAVGTPPTYLDPVAGWTRKGIRFAGASTTHFDRVIPPAPADSFLILLYVAINNTPSAQRAIAVHPNVRAQVTATGRFRVAGASQIAGTIPTGTTVHPLVLQSSIALGTLALFTDDEVLSGGFATTAGTTITIGTVASNSAPMSVLYAATFEGIAADMLSAEVRSMLIALGWTVAW